MDGSGLPVDAFGLHNLMLSFSSPPVSASLSSSSSSLSKPELRNESREAVPACKNGDEEKLQTEHPEAEAEAEAEAAAAAHRANYSVLPAHLAEAQKYLRFTVEAHPQFGDEDGGEILKDLPRYAREIYKVPAIADEESFHKLRAIPRVSLADRDIFEEALRLQIPMILTDSTLVSRSCSKWTPEYLQEKFGDTQKLTVYRSKSRYFRYWSEEHHTGTFPFSEPTDSVKMTFSDFLERIKGDDGANKDGYFYLQEGLSGHPELADDFRSWDFAWLLEMTKKNGWGSPDTNSLFIGMEGNCTPIHFDDQENLFCQIQGCKEVLVYPPSDYKAFYPFPVTHACDRQSMVNVDDPDLKRFPNHRFARPHWAMLRPGETFYLPGQWWHHFRNRQAFASSVTFWAKQCPFDMTKFSVPMPEKTLFSVRRNVESMVGNSVGKPNLDAVLSNVLQYVKSKEDPVTKSQFFDKQTISTYAELKQLLLNVLLPIQIDSFIIDIIEGRYGTNDTEKWVVPKTSTSHHK